MAISIEDLRAIAARVRAEAAAAGELVPSKIGEIHWDIPDAARAAVLEDITSGTYQQAVREAIVGDSDMIQLESTCR